MLIRKLPLSSVVTPAFEFLTITDTFGIGVFFSSVTFPLITIPIGCEKATDVIILISVKNRICLFIYLVFGLPGADWLIICFLYSFLHDRLVNNVVDFRQHLRFQVLRGSMDVED